jgi:hypothetical protein
MDCKEQGGKSWTRFIWLRIGSNGESFWTRWWNLGLHKRRGIYWLAEWLLASQEGLYFMELVSISVHRILTSVYFWLSYSGAYRKFLLQNLAHKTVPEILVVFLSPTKKVLGECLKVDYGHFPVLCISSLTLIISFNATKTALLLRVRTRSLSLSHFMAGGGGVGTVVIA